MKWVAVAGGSVCMILAASAVNGQGIESVSPGECGKCVDSTYPFPPYMDVHRLEQGTESVCSGGGGHPTHDCVNGDPEYWYVEGTCEFSHPACEGSVAIAAVRQVGVLSRERASALEVQYGRFISYDAFRGVVSARDCRGSLAAVVEVASKEP